MQSVNDDMDNLFRQAAENYPLNTQGADFDELLQRMDAAGEDTPPQKENRWRYGWLLLLLLIPLPFLCRHYYAPGAKDELVIAEQQVSTKTEKAATVSTPEASTPKSSGIDNGNILTDNTFADTDSIIAQANSTRSTLLDKNAGPQQKSGLEKSKMLHKNSNPQTTETSTGTVYSTKKSIGINDRRYKRSSGKLGAETSSTGLANEQNKAVLHNHSSQEKEIASGIAQPATTSSRQPDSLLQTDSDKLIANKLNDTGNTTIAKKGIAKDSTATDSTSVVKKQRETNKKLRPFLYAGATAGVDYSVVKSNQTAGTGYNAGLVAGYRFGQHWAVETGLLWAYKKYRAEGEYIDTGRLGLAPHTQVMNAKGSCGILEIPLMVQYHFSGKSRNHWYAAAGLSSYIIKKEEYYYMGKRYNMQYYAEKEYTNSTKNWFSILQLGGGYQLQLGKRSSLRAEPYVKLPLSKIGIAKLPLSSAGINIGYVRPL